VTTSGRVRLLTDEQWRPFADHRRIIEGIIYR